MKINFYHSFFFFVILCNFLVYLIRLVLFQGFKRLSFVKLPTNQQPIFLTIDIIHATKIETNSHSLTQYFHYFLL